MYQNLVATGIVFLLMRCHIIVEDTQCDMKEKLKVISAVVVVQE